MGKSWSFSKSCTKVFVALLRLSLAPSAPLDPTRHSLLSCKDSKEQQTSPAWTSPAVGLASCHS